MTNLPDLFSKKYVLLFNYKLGKPGKKYPIFGLSLHYFE